MEDFELKYFAKRLKEIAQRDFGGIGKLAEKIGVSNLSNYTKEDGYEPRAKLLYNLQKLGIDINYLLGGEKKLNKEELEKRFSLLESRILELEAENYRNIKKIEKLTENEVKLEKEKEVLLSQVVTLNQEVCTKALKGQ